MSYHGKHWDGTYRDVTAEPALLAFGLERAARELEKAAQGLWTYDNGDGVVGTIQQQLYDRATHLRNIASRKQVDV